MKHLHVALSVVVSLVWATAAANAQSWMEVQKLHAGHGTADDEFAQTVFVSISGDRAIVSAFWNDDNGSEPASAYVFERNGMGTWNLVSRLVTGDAPSDNVYGPSVDVSISGDAAILGVSFNDDNGEQAGSAYVFERDVTGIWNQVAKLLASDGEADDQFGSSVSISGNRAIVGTPSDDDNGGGSGSAYIFERDETGEWNEVAKLLANDGDTMDAFGNSVSICGDRAIVGALGDEHNGLASGSAYLFQRDGTGTWSQFAKLLARDGDANDQLGRSVALSGDRAIVGAQGNADNGGGSGSAYIFEWDETGEWNEVAKLLANDGDTMDAFGNSVSVCGDRVIVGAPCDEDYGFYSGSAYLFERDGTGRWNQVAKLLASDGTDIDQFGQSVSISDGRAIVGAFVDAYPEDPPGSAYVFETE